MADRVYEWDDTEDSGVVEQQWTVHKPVQEDNCITGLTAEMQQAADAALAEDSAKAAQALVEDAQAVLNAFDQMVDEESVREAQALASKEKLLSFMGGESSDKAKVRQVMQALMETRPEDRQAEVIDLPLPPSMRREPVEPPNRNGMHQRTYKGRMRDKKGRVFGFAGFGQYAVDRSEARDQFNKRTQQKPWWAVYALVWLREAGMCQVCNTQVYHSGHVKQLVPVASGGQYSESNCVLVCEWCKKAWPTNNHFTTPAVEYHFWQLAVHVMRRRMQCKGGSKGISEASRKQLEVYKQRIEHADMQARKAVQTVQQKQQDVLSSKLLV